jgi:integrase
VENLARRKNSANLYYRESLPEDVKAILVARDGRAPTEKWISLRTADPKEAKRRLVKVQAEQHAEWDALRNAAVSSNDLPSIAELADAAEIAQLLPSDIRQEEGVWVFDFIETDEESSDPKSLKTESSRRIVPVHSALLNLGLLDFVRRALGKGQTRLFPEIRPCKRGMLSTQPSKFWQRYLKRLGVKERGLALHSFRHTLVDEVRRKGGSDAVLGTILGHAKGTITAHYGTLREGNLAQRRAMIDMVDYEGLHSLIGSDLSAVAA